MLLILMILPQPFLPMMRPTAAFTKTDPMKLISMVSRISCSSKSRLGPSGAIAEVKIQISILPKSSLILSITASTSAFFSTCMI